MLDKKLRSFGYALKGIRIAWREEFNFKFQAILAGIAFFLSWFLQIQKGEFLTILFLIGFVLTAEIFNTALEELCDKFSSEHDPHIGKIKDLAAGAVFVAATTAFIIGLAIFLPYLLPQSV